MQKFNFSYDKGNNDLFIYNPKSKSKGSVEFGDLIIDYSPKKEIVGIQIMNASKFIKELAPENNFSIKEILDNLELCKVDIKIRNNLSIIKIYLLSKNKEITTILSVPTIIKTSPALAY